MRACILVGTGPDAARPVAAALDALPGVLVAFPVLGRPEVVVRADVRDMEDLGRLLSKITATADVLVSETLLEIPEAALQ